MASQPFAVFDIDGTLIRWQLYHALADELALMGYLDPARFNKVKSARMAWKKRSDTTSFNDYEQTLVKLVRSAIIGIKVVDFEQACRNVLSEYKDQVYTYTRDLIRDLKAKGYLLFTISGSQIEIVSVLAKYYGFTDFGGSIYETKDGYFTGKFDIMLNRRKPDYLKQLVVKHNASWQGSIGVGDSENDIDMLEAVDQPIAFNPTKELFNYAKKNNWSIVLERKNMIYTLEAVDGKYRLKA